jgi:hypothetical protein
MVGVLLNRQLRSPTAVAVDGHRRQVAARGGRSREEG